MAIFASRAPSDKVEMSVQEFSKWLMQFDYDKDGKITMEELREAVRANGQWFTTWKAKHGLKLADKNRNGVIDDYEICNLVEFAEKHLGRKIISTY
ncbi:UNVERIFIED_CONTAM: hypothetical protein Sangu_2328500 [Sesamum angustifolium]|uniref:EF-hand domain-containing protein n=1 Tax=Sesamum angustifolium TaxID=2727405 RepID=A0AAW2L9I8_9LAMI